MLIKEKINIIKKNAIIASKTLGILFNYIKEPGFDLLYLNKIATEYIRDNGGEPAFLGLYNYPFSICTSINNEIVHGIPRKRVLREGDIITVDCGVLKNDYYSDVAYTYGVGEITKKKKKILNITKKALYIGIKNCKIGKKIGNIGYHINKYTTKKKFFVIKDLVGHCIGKKLHKLPYIPNFGSKYEGKEIKNGMVLSIEPMISEKKSKIKKKKDRWTYITKNGCLSAHYEHNVAILKNKTILLSTYKYIEKKKCQLYNK